MQDFDAVRAQLGVQQINAVGISYGTRAILEYMRQFPDHVRRAVLDSVAPPDMVMPLSASTDAQHAIEAVFDACSAEASCRARFPHLRDEWKALIASLPRQASVADPISGEQKDITITRDMFLLHMVRGPLYSSVLASALPAAIHAAALGNFNSLYGLANAFGGSLGKKTEPIATGMFLSVICPETMHLIGDQHAIADNPPGTDFLDLDTRFFKRACSNWPLGDIPEAFFHIHPSHSPVLIVSGGIDPVTPPRHGERAHKALGEKAVHVVVPNSGHSVLGQGCGPDILTRFISETNERTALAVDTQCLSQIPRPNAFLPLTGKAGARHD
jgi:pimeloyl-ACP methyl ester carboxylesterase